MTRHRLAENLMSEFESIILKPDIIYLEYDGVAIRDDHEGSQEGDDEKDGGEGQAGAPVHGAGVGGRGVVKTEIKNKSYKIKSNISVSVKRKRAEKNPKMPWIRQSVKVTICSVSPRPQKAGYTSKPVFNSDI